MQFLDRSGRDQMNFSMSRRGFKEIVNGVGSHLFELLLKTPVLLRPKVARTVALAPWCRLRKLELDMMKFFFSIT